MGLHKSMCSQSASSINLEFLTAAVEVLLLGRSVIMEMPTVFDFSKHAMCR